METNLRQPSQAEPFKRPTIFFQLIEAILQRRIMLPGKLHELLHGGLAELGSAAYTSRETPFSKAARPPNHSSPSRLWEERRVQNTAQPVWI